MISRKELARIYGCSTRTIVRMLKSIGITHRMLISPVEYDLFVMNYGKVDAR